LVQVVMVTPNACRLATTVARGLLSIVLTHNTVTELVFLSPNQRAHVNNPARLCFISPSQLNESLKY